MISVQKTPKFRLQSHDNTGFNKIHTCMHFYVKMRMTQSKDKQNFNLKRKKKTEASRCNKTTELAFAIICSISSTFL